MKTPPRQLRWLLIFFSIFVTLVFWAIASPPGSTPDEAYHVGNIWCAFGESSNCMIRPGASEGYRWADIPFSVDLCFKPSAEISARCISREHPKNQVVPIDNIKSMYPSHYYKVSHFWFSILPTNGVLAVRVFNSLLFSALLVLGLLLVNHRWRHGLISSFFIFLVPQGSFLIASVNPSSWAFTGALFSPVYTSAFLYQRNLRNNKLALVALFGLAVSITIGSARTDSMLFVGLLIVACAITFFTANTRKSSTVFLLSLTPLALFAVSEASTFITSIRLRVSEMISDPEFFSFARYWLIHFLEIPLTSMGLNYGSYGPIGSIDVITPPLVGHIQFGLLSAAVLWGLKERNRLQRSFFVVLLITLYVLILQEVSRSHETGFYVVQGRYFLPLIAGSITVILALTSSRMSLFGFPAIKSLLLCLLTISHTLALFAIVRRYSYGTTNDYKRFEIDVDKNFSLPDGWRYVSFLSPRAVLIGGSIAFAIAAWLIVTMLNTDDEPDKPSEKLVQET